MENSLDNLLLNKRTKTQLLEYISSPTSSLLITGVTGSGKSTVAHSLSAGLLRAGNLDSYPYFFKLSRPKNKKDIPIENVREVIGALKLKIPGKQATKRVVFIEDAHYLSIPAQNAILKVLEEPSQDTVFILSATSIRSVLPTIASRARQLNIEPVGLDEISKSLDGKYSQAQLNSAWRLSGGAVGLLFALLSEEQQHPLLPAVENAKSFLRSSKYERLLLVDRLSKDKEEFFFFLEALSRTLSALHRSAVKNKRQLQAKALLADRRTLQKITESTENNANNRLAALNLAINLKV
jgi:replication-associated recombination protein RarA